MSQEIERKFLVKADFRQDVESSTRIMQGYLSTIPERIVRVRINGEKGFITIKGVTNDSGVSRYEWEKEIPLSEARELLSICEPDIIDKTRFLVKVKNFTFEIDEFYGDNAGLIVAEVELVSEEDIFEKPEWLGEEVTGDKRYYNSKLSKHPYSKW